MTISEYLLDKGMTIVRTMSSDRAGIPKEMKETKSHKSPSTLYAYNTDIKLVLVSYVIKTKSGVKNVLVLSSTHRTKGGVDMMDMMAEIHTTQFKSHRWTMNALAYLFDTVRTNMFTLWRKIHSDNKPQAAYSKSLPKCYRITTECCCCYEKGFRD